MHDPIRRIAADPAAAAQQFAQSPLVPGIAIAGVVDGEIALAAGGEAAIDTPFRPGSITKLLTATLVAQCAEEGPLALDDPLSSFVDGFDERIKIRHLITHSLGIDAGDVFIDTGDDDGALVRYRAPGNCSTRGPRSPAGGTLVSTVADMGRFLADHLAHGDRSWMRDLAAPAPGGVALMRGAGAGWMVWYGSTRVGGANPGYSGYLALDDGATCAIAALTNGEQGVNAVSMELDAGAPTPPDQGPPPTDLHQYEGEYSSHIINVTVRVVDGTLTAHLNGGSAPLVPQDTHTFSSPLGPIAFFDGLARLRMRCLRKVA